MIFWNNFLAVELRSVNRNLQRLQIKGSIGKRLIIISSETKMCKGITGAAELGAQGAHLRTQCLGSE